jgi:nucleoside-diphosphate-sugar epimerase
MAENIYRLAVKTKVKKVIMASSVHADKFYDWKGPGLISPYRFPTPTSPYGASKLYIEALGRFFAQKYKLEVICIRLGWVNKQNAPIWIKGKSWLAKTWLSHRDCIELFKRCIEAKKVPRNFVILYGVSDNKGRFHDLKNPFNWRPKDGWKKINFLLNWEDRFLRSEVKIL